MALGTIPSVISPGEAFFQAATNTQNILSKILEGKQRQQELAETAKYHQGDIAVRRMAESRAQQLMPYMIQKYKDEHGKEASSTQLNNIFNNLIKQGYYGYNENTQQQSIPQPQNNQIPSNPSTNNNLINSFLSNASPKNTSYSPVNSVQSYSLPNFTQINPDTNQQQPIQDVKQSNERPLIPGTSIPSFGKGPLVDAWMLKRLGITMPNVANSGFKDTLQQVMQTNMKAASFDKMPSRQREYALDQAMGFGLSNTEATKRLRNGETMEEIAKSKGYDTNKPDTWPLPKAPPTMAMQTQQQRSNVARAAVNAIEPIIANAIAPYSKNWNGTSPALLADAIKGENPDKQARALAAAFTSTELNQLLAKAGGVQNIGIELLRDMREKSLNGLTPLKATLSQDVYKKTQQYIKEYSNIINRAENAAMWSQQQNEYDNLDKLEDNQPIIDDLSKYANLTDEQLEQRGNE